MLRIFIGYDGREAVAFHALVASILEHASVPVSIVPLRLSLLGAVALNLVIAVNHRAGRYHGA